MSEVIERCAADLAHAELQRRPIGPLTERYPTLSLSDAYAIQLTNVARRKRQGERVVGHKVGLTAVAMQKLFGVHEPDYGHLLAPMLHDPREPLDLGELIDPQIEVEPAFVLGSRLAGPGLTPADILAATDYVSVCFEVIDSRIIDWRIRVEDTVADNGSSARVILGAARVQPDAIALDALDAELEIDGAIVARGNTGAILGHPAHSVAWLANTLAQFGVALEAGDIVLPGTCTLSRRLLGHRRATGRMCGLGEVSVVLENAPFVREARR
jgi:2-oxopent-4-enoate hydratase